MLLARPLLKVTTSISGFKSGLVQWISAAAMLALTGVSGAADWKADPSLFVDLSLRPDARSLAAFDLCVLNPHAELDMEPGHAMGNQYFALLDAGHVHLGTREALLAADRKLKWKASSDKKLNVIDPTDAQWLPWVVESQVDPAAKKGFDGFVLSLGDQSASQTARAAVLALAATLRQRYPDKRILLDLRIGLGIETIHMADGFLALGVYTQEARNGGVDWTSIADVQRLSRAIRSVQMHGMKVFAVDYAPADDRNACNEAAQRLISMGIVPFITTPALSGINLGPLEEVSRRVLVLHGWDAKHVGEKAAAPDTTLASRHLRQPLEWLGCQMDFRLAEGADFLPANHDFAAVILDSSLVLNHAQQRELAAWLPSLRVKKTPVLLTGMPWTDSAARHLAMQHLSLGGSAQLATRLIKTKVAGMDSTLLRSNAQVNAHMLGFLDLQAPSDAHIVFAMKGQDALGTEHRFDQAFLASWGGAWMDTSTDAAAPQLDLHAFLGQWLGANHSAPVPDTTTRDGRRVFYSHIDSSGFSEPSTLPGFPLCSELMRDRILSRYLLPVTVSVCEAEMRSWLPDQKAADALRFEQIARSIFDLLQIEAATNSFTRPTQWTAGIDIARPLNERAKTTRLDMEREIAGSMSYIHRRLLPLGKNVNLMLWPDHVAPTAEAVHFSRAMTAENLPAGPFTLSMQHPADAAAPAKSIRTEPVAVRCRFSDMRTEQGIVALEKTFDACAAEPLHAITASKYAASLRDARHTRILRAGADRWIILNQGAARTLRMPVSAGVPDIAESTGVSGYTVHQDQVYIHTMGRARTELVMTREKPAQHVFVVESSAEIEFMELSSRRGTFQVRDLRPVEIVLGGFDPRGSCAYLENGRPYTVTADAAGIVHIELACRSIVSFQSLPPATQAVMR